MDLEYEIGDKIKRYRKERGLTQKELAESCGMFDSAIRRYESNRANPKLETLEKIANALNVNVTDLLDITIEQQANPERTKTFSIDQKLLHVGYKLCGDEDGNTWLEHNGNTIDITMKEILALDKETDEFLLFKLQQLERR